MENVGKEKKKPVELERERGIRGIVKRGCRFIEIEMEETMVVRGDLTGDTMCRLAHK